MTGTTTAAGGVGALLQIADHTSGKTFLPCYDGNGNVVALINADTGATAAAYEWSPYGEALRSEALDPVVADQPFRFSTKFYDGETGLYYYGRRYMSPSQGRFLGRDPLEEQGGLNLYGFCNNDGVNRWDFMGEYYSMEEKDGVIIVTVPLLFSNNVTAEDRTSFLAVADLTWGGTQTASDGRKVHVNFVEISEQPKNSEAYNRINILDMNPDTRSETAYFGADRAAIVNLNNNAENFNRLVGHELGHVLGNEDHYEVLYRLPDGSEKYARPGTYPHSMIVKGAPDKTITGWEGNVMGDDTNRPDKRNYDEMLKRPQSISPRPVAPGPTHPSSDPYQDYALWIWRMSIAIQLSRIAQLREAATDMDVLATTNEINSKNKR